MPSPANDGPRSGDDVQPSPVSLDRTLPRPSSRVQLEVELLTSGWAPPPPVAGDVADARERRAILVVSRDADFRRYVRECLLEERGLQLLDAGSTEAALERAATRTVHLTITDASGAGILAHLPDVPVLMAADTLPTAPAGDAATAPRIALALPLTAQLLREHVRQLIG